MKKYILSIAFVVSVSACGGSGGNEGSPSAGGDDGVTYGELRSDYDRIRKDSARIAQNQGYTSELPTSGTATYSGVASFSERATPQIIANANLTADFSDSSISGELTDFRGDDGTVFDGAMSMSQGEIDASDSSITADISGRLTSASARMSTVDAAGEFTAHFIGDNHRYVRGQTSAMWTTNAGMGTEEHILMQGELAAEKQY